MREFATLAATVDALGKLNMEEHGLFFRLYSLDANTGELFLDYKAEAGRRETIGRIYESRSGFYCVAVDGDIWQAPVVWNGTKASWDTSTNADLLAEFAACIRHALANRLESSH